MPNGSKCYVTECTADNHYLKSEAVYPVIFTFGDSKEKEVNIDLNDGKPIENKLIRGSFIGKKTDENGNALKGVKFGLFKNYKR